MSIIVALPIDCCHCEWMRFRAQRWAARESLPVDRCRGEWMRFRAQRWAEQELLLVDGCQGGPSARFAQAS